MSKRKKNLHRKPTGSSSIPRTNIAPELLEEFHELIGAGNWTDCYARLLKLERSFPEDEVILALLSKAALALGRTRDLERAATKLHRLRPNQPESVLLLEGAYHSSARRALALRTFEQFVRRWPYHAESASVQEDINTLRPIVFKILKTQGWDNLAGATIAADHELAQSLLDIGEYDQS